MLWEVVEEEEMEVEEGVEAGAAGDDAGSATDDDDEGACDGWPKLTSDPIDPTAGPIELGARPRPAQLPAGRESIYPPRAAVPAAINRRASLDPKGEEWWRGSAASCMNLPCTFR